MSEPAPQVPAVHTYPLPYAPGSSWACTEAWAILDSLRPGVLSDDVRAFLAGQITGVLTHMAHEGAIHAPRPQGGGAHAD